MLESNCSTSPLQRQVFRQAWLEVECTLHDVIYMILDKNMLSWQDFWQENSRVSGLVNDAPSHSLISNNHIVPSSCSNEPR